jgi:hypothetical protein
MTEAKLVPLLAAGCCWLPLLLLLLVLPHPLLLLPPTAMATRPLALPCGYLLPNLISAGWRSETGLQAQFCAQRMQTAAGRGNAFLIAVHAAVVEIAGFIFFAPTTRAVV